MGGKGAWRVNVFIVRFWRSLKYEEVYFRAKESASEASFERNLAVAEAARLP
jgi:putative transposase